MAPIGPLIGELPASPASQPLVLWGGAECTVVRVGGVSRDQTRETGHHRRLDDLDRVASLGIRTLRTGVLWERCTKGDAWCGFDWHDERLGRMANLGISPIVGLVHHGSGPEGADPLDPAWPEALAAHAAAVAERYPWVEAWTPVNEPLTTARFGALYGFWHPHACTPDSFAVMVINQCYAVLLSMRAIRRHVPNARLVQTEDFGRVFSTAPMAGQASYENQRRWLSLDLLYGRVDQAHPWWRHFEALGYRRQLDALLTGEAVPDLLGVNHYVTSDRFLDHRTALYPAHLRGGNGRTAYVDTEAARMDLPDHLTGWEPRLREAWLRYRSPMAITEAHIACVDQEEQVRWLLEAWQAARALRREGAPIEAVTVWSLFGAVDWDSMLRHDHGRYESGVWDARHEPPRPTLLAEAVASLTGTGGFDHPSLDEPGWWRRHDRLHEAARRA